MPPLDRMRKIRRDIVRSINDYREQFSSNLVFTDIISNRVATEYAEFLLDNDEDPLHLQQICDKHLLVGNVVPLVGFAYLEDEDVGGNGEDKILYHEFMDAHGLLCELEDELNKFTAKEVTHVGVGFAWNK